MKKTAKEFWDFAPMDHVEYMFKQYGLVQITKWGETVKEFNKTILRHERAEKDILERLKKCPEQTDTLQWSLDVVRAYLDRCYEVKKVLGVRFSKEGVHALAKYNKEFTATRYAELVAENEQLKRELKELKESIRTTTAGMLQLMEV